MSVTNEEKPRLQEFCQLIKVDFANLDLLKESLTHKSFANEVKPQKCSHNERLEFLGDAVLELSITRHLFNAYPKRPEGELTSFRAALVRKESLAETAMVLKFGEYLYMSRGEESTGGRTRAYILANAYEAVLGAIYIEKGFDAADEFIRRTLMPKLKEIVDNRSDLDAKSKVQELAQEVLKLTPRYDLIGEEGPDHNKFFTMGLFVGVNLFAEGKGRSKQEAEQKAADLALKNWHKLYSKFYNSGTIASANNNSQNS